MSLSDINIDIQKEIGEYLCICNQKDYTFNNHLIVNDKCNIIKYKHLKECIYHGNPIIINIIEELSRYYRVHQKKDHDKNNIILHFKDKETADYFCSIRFKLGFKKEIKRKCCSGKGIVFK